LHELSIARQYQLSILALCSCVKTTPNISSGFLGWKRLKPAYLYIDNYAADMSLLACEANGVQRDERVWVYKAAYIGVEEQRVNAPRERL